MNSLSPLPLNSTIRSVAINASGNGLIGGQDYSSNAPYAALVSSSGAVNSLSPLPSAGTIYSVAINASGNGLIGGQDSTGSSPAYAALISSLGAVNSLSALPLSGIIASVAINVSGNGLIGGEDDSSGAAYAALFSPLGVVTALSSLPLNGTIRSVAINASGNGLIGGEDLSVNLPPYAALVSPLGAVTPLSSLPLKGEIFSVAINASGNGLIGGQDYSSSAPAYAAFVSSSGTVTSLSSLPLEGYINSVAINDSGNGLIGGVSSSAAYAALVSSSGTVIPLSLLPSSGSINSVAVIDFLFPLLSHIPTEGLTGNNLKLANYINNNSPDTAFYFVPSEIDGTLLQALESSAPTRHAFDVFIADNNLFFLNNSFIQHAEDMRHYWLFQEQYCPRIAEGRITHERQESSCPCELTKRPHQIWSKVLGTASRQKAQHQAPTFQPWTTGFILGFDAHSSPTSAYGIGTAYTYTYNHQRQNAGHSRIDQEYLFVYGMWNNEHFYGDAAIWGGLFQIHNTRNIEMTGFQFKSSSHPKGWQLAPHAEAGYHNNYKITTFEPFAMFDWISNWQGHYREKGSGPLNFGQKSQYSSFLRSELGLRLYETIDFDMWRLVFQEKGSYVNRKPFHVGNVTAYLVGAPGSFTVETLTTPQNVGTASAKVLFESHNPCSPYGSISYQGEFSPTYQSHQLAFNVGWNF